jgi:thiol-disulfide isomerase/thioredoxin
VESDPTQSFAARIPRAIIVTVLVFGAAYGASAPSLPLTLTDPADGRPVEVRAGAPVLHLVFFATWCPPCRDELPRLNEIVTRWGDHGYRLVVVGVPARQSPQRLREFFEDQPFEGEALFDAGGSAQGRFRGDQLPFHVVLNESGEVVLRAPGLNEEVESTVERMMLEHARRAGNG